MNHEIFYKLIKAGVAPERAEALSKSKDVNGFEVFTTLVKGGQTADQAEALIKSLGLELANGGGSVGGAGQGTGELVDVQALRKGLDQIADLIKGDVDDDEDDFDDDDEDDFDDDDEDGEPMNKGRLFGQPHGGTGASASGNWGMDIDVLVKGTDAIVRESRRTQRTLSKAMGQQQQVMGGMLEVMEQLQAGQEALSKALGTPLPRRSITSGYEPEPAPGERLNKGGLDVINGGKARYQEVLSKAMARIEDNNTPRGEKVALLNAVSELNSGIDPNKVAERYAIQ